MVDVDNLSLRESLFVAAMITHGKKRQAAIDAGVAVGNAAVEANRMLNKVKIKTILAAANVEIIDDAMNEAKIDAAWVLSELKRLYDANLDDFTKVNNRGDPYFDFSNVNRDHLGCLDSLEVRPGKFGTSIKVGLPNKKQILELIGKHIDVDAFREKVEHSGAVTLNFDPEDENA